MVGDPCYLSYFMTKLAQPIQFFSRVRSLVAALYCGSAAGGWGPRDVMMEEVGKTR